ncbi:hypothetical protein CEQ90_17620 [Lewinellaceae bacterium SD302]|nr:hypothetical protein CEQ90_17620 [Lewinellaceae bacterium SD302]
MVRKSGWQRGIKLGNHQTDLKFVLPPTPVNIETIRADIPAFTENENHQTIFSYLVAGKNEHVILHRSNDFRANIQLGATNINNSWLWVLPFGLALLALLAFITTKFKSSTLEPIS